MNRRTLLKLLAAIPFAGKLKPRTSKVWQGLTSPSPAPDLPFAVSYWIEKGDGVSYDDPANWSRGQVPGSKGRAVIHSAETVLIPADANVAELQIYSGGVEFCDA